MFKVLTRTLSGWDDCWTEDGEPQRFTTEAEAQAEIDDLLREMPDYSADDYQIEREINFDATAEDYALIEKIISRYLVLADINDDAAECELTMDITACHLNGCSLDLQRLLDAEDFNLIHDVAGINRRIDRGTAQLTGAFRPRFAVKQCASCHEPSCEAQCLG